MRNTKDIIEDLKHYFADVPLVIEAVEKLEHLESYNANLAAANAELSCELLDTAKKLDIVTGQRDNFAKRTDEGCNYCKHNVECLGEKCGGFCKGIGDAEGKYPTWKWTCEDFKFGTCAKREGTPCDGCFDNDFSGFEWKEPESNVE